METLKIRPLQSREADTIAMAFAAIGWGGKAREQYLRYAREQDDGRRVTLVAFWQEGFAGYLNVVWEADYLPFRDAGIPTIEDFNVLPALQRRGIGTCLMDAAEETARTRSATVGIGVGLTADYGAAQQLYVRRGYTPDGRGITYYNQPLAWGAPVLVDDDLVLWLTKTFPSEESGF